jgi:EAL and modified HD-GYP domain-containing signal transduction protein
MTSGLSSRSASEARPSLLSPKQGEVFICRQPIHNRQLSVVGYSILLHGNATARAQDYVATSQMLEHAFIDIGLEAIVGKTRACMRLTRGFLLLDYTTVFPPERVIVEIAPDTLVDTELLTTIRALATQGYTITLPDVLAYAHLYPLVDVAGIILFDLSTHVSAVIQEHVAQLQPYAVKLLAREVNTPEDFAFCHTLGINYVQGHFFCQPDVLKGQRVSTNRLSIMQVLAKLMQPDTEFEELEALVRCDVSLSYKLLRLINSSFFGLSRNITSIRQALLLLGMKQVTTWVSLMLLAGVDDKPHELAVTAMMRARMCELLAKAMSQKNTETFFLVGLFSILDAVMDRPLSELLAALPLAEEVSRALLHHEGLYGAILHAVLAYERGDWKPVKQLGLDSDVINDAYLQAIAWSREYGAVQ